MFPKVLHRLLGPLYTPLRMRLEGLSAAQATTAVLLGQLLAESHRRRSPFAHLTEAEFRVFSQFGEDGIIQYLVSQVPVPDPVFVEIGVGDYGEANTRYLLVANKWRGLVIEGTTEDVQAIWRSDLSWRCRLSALAAFVTAENVNALIESAGFAGDIGLLSLDIDGNEYWLWNSLTAIRPRIVVCEFNKLFGHELAVTIPYDENFVAHRAHPSRLYAGASLSALCVVAARQGYSLVGSTSEGVNAFFVRDDVRGSLARISPRECFALITPPCRADVWGSGSGLQAIGHLPVLDVESGVVTAIRELAVKMVPWRE